MSEQNKKLFTSIDQEIQKKLSDYHFNGFILEQGIVINISASVLIARGISNSFCGEMIKINDDSLAFVFGFISNDRVQLILLKEGSPVHTGDPVYRTGNPLTIPVGRALLGRVVNPIGMPLNVVTHREEHRRDRHQCSRGNASRDFHCEPHWVSGRWQRRG